MIVLDTNVLVSGLLQPRGRPARIVGLALARRVRLAVDARILAEYRDVIRRPELRIDPILSSAVLRRIETTSLRVAPRPLERRLPDPDDEPFLEVALAANVEHLVTGNVRHFPPSLRGGMSVLSPAEWLNRFREG